MRRQLYLVVLIMTLWWVRKLVHCRKAIDEILMEAAPSVAFFDLFDISPEGDLMMTVELDIRMDIKQYMELMGDQDDRRKKRKAIANGEKYKWKNCTIFYEITAADFTDAEQKVLLEAINEWERYTCLRFLTATSQTVDKIIFKTGNRGCYSRLGRMGGSQDIVLEGDCVQKGVVVHEIGHAVGWFHEHSRPDRDQFIRINYNRIPSTWHSQFDLRSRNVINNFHVVYDYGSIMHYSGNAVVPRSIETLEPEYQNVIGQRDGLSFRDIQLANLMYDCPSVTCPMMSADCSQNGGDAFLFKLLDVCQCVCPGNSQQQPLLPCKQSQPTTAMPTTTTTRDTTTTTEGVLSSDCVDVVADCTERKQIGQCVMDMEHMEKFCRKTCNFCQIDDLCMDSDPSCPLLAAGKFCQNNVFQSLMEKQCKKSCGLCKPIEPCDMQRMLGFEVRDSSSGHIQATISTVWALCALAVKLLAHPVCLSC